MTQRRRDTAEYSSGGGDLRCRSTGSRWAATDGRVCGYRSNDRSGLPGCKWWDDGASSRDREPVAQPEPAIVAGCGQLCRCRGMHDRRERRLVAVEPW